MIEAKEYGVAVSKLQIIRVLQPILLPPSRGVDRCLLTRPEWMRVAATPWPRQGMVTLLRIA